MHFIGSALLESLSLWERWHCEAMTERASSARKSRCAAMGRLFVSAKRALHLCFPASSLALSGASRQLSQRESLLPSYYASPSPDGLGGIDLRPAGAESVGGGFGLGFGAEHAEDRRAAAGHEGSDGPILPEGGLDGLEIGRASCRERV